MSILLRDPDDGLIKLYTKGADSEIIKRLDPQEINRKLKDKIDTFLTKASLKGLRTLLMGVRVVEEEELK